MARNRIWLQIEAEIQFADSTDSKQVCSITDYFCYLCFLIGGSCLQTERHTETGLRFYCWENQVAILSQFSFLSVISNSNRTASRRSTKTNFLFFEKLNLRILISLCACQVDSITIHINSTLRRKKKISRREENPKVDHPGGSSSQSLHRLK